MLQCPPRRLAAAAAAQLRRINALAYVEPVAQLDRLVPRARQVVSVEGRLERALALAHARLVGRAQRRQRLGGSGGGGGSSSLLNLLARVHDGSQQVWVVDARRLVVDIVDSAATATVTAAATVVVPAQREQVPRALQRVQQRAVGLVDARRRGLGARARRRRVPVRVRAALQLQELLAQLRRVDGEGAARRRAERQGAPEEVVVGCWLGGGWGGWWWWWWW
jgi:hypothetical protein